MYKFASAKSIAVMLMPSSVLLRTSVARLATILTLFVTVVNHGASAQNSWKRYPPVKPQFQINTLQMRAKYANKVPGTTQSTQPPGGFPVPVYSFNAQSANFAASTSAKNPSAASGTIITTDPPDKPYRWYHDYFAQNGWTIKDMPVKSAAEKQGKLLCINATKDKVNVTVACVKPDKAQFSIVNISTFASSK